MKTNEFIKEVEAMGLIVTSELKINGESLEVRNQDSGLIATVKSKQRFGFYNHYNSFEALEEDEKQQLFNLLAEYANTPIEEREEEKEYVYYKDDIFVDKRLFLYYKKDYQQFVVSSEHLNLHSYQLYFTEKELKELGLNIEKLNSGWKRAEV